MKVFTLADGSYLILPPDAKYELVSKRLMIQGGSPAQEVHRLEDTIAEINKAIRKIKRC